MTIQDTLTIIFNLFFQTIKKPRSIKNEAQTKTTTRKGGLDSV